ncbi:ABC transporter permease [Mycolicibacterium neoaurum]|uniref:ABC transporter permease n=1 Tax=Mycolicibacterium neoaurum TaxID=1795 RepID=UPI000ABE25E1
MAAAAVVVAGLLLPLWYLAQRANERGLGFVVRELIQPRTAALVGRSALLVVVVTVACVVLGVGFAVLIRRTDIPARRALTIALTLPLAMPSYLLSYLWVSTVPGITGFWGAALVLTLVSYPLIMMPTLAALARSDPAQEEVARSLGLNGFAVLCRVTLRQARAAIAAGALLVALYVLSDFGAVAAMRYEAFTWVIYGSYRSGFNPARAAVLSLVLLVLAVALVLAEHRARGRALDGCGVVAGGGGADRRPDRPVRRAGGLVVGRRCAIRRAAVVVCTRCDGLVVRRRRGGVHRGRPAARRARRALPHPHHPDARGSGLPVPRAALDRRGDRHGLGRGVVVAPHLSA